MKIVVYNIIILMNQILDRTKKLWILWHEKI